ncbi:MAG: hypothetical protein INR71_11730 [Terriglobus roseus]|nr:hypothetical protein [Terriglobus roseus]
MVLDVCGAYVGTEAEIQNQLQRIWSAPAGSNTGLTRHESDATIASWTGSSSNPNSAMNSDESSSDDGKCVGLSR